MEAELNTPHVEAASEIGNNLIPHFFFFASWSNEFHPESHTAYLRPHSQLRADTERARLLARVRGSLRGEDPAVSVSRWEAIG